MDANKIIDALGGTSAVAKLCEVTPQAVSQWREDGIPQARMMFVKVVRPDIFDPPPRAQCPCPEAVSDPKICQTCGLRLAVTEQNEERAA